MSILKVNRIEPLTSGSTLETIGLLVSGTLEANSFTGSFIGDGSGLTNLNHVLEGTQYIYVQADGTDTENATELQSAYNTAKTMSPSATNRITVVAGIGNYDFGTSSFDMDTQYIDLVSLDGNRSVILNHTLNTSNRTEGSINITANDVFVKGVDVGDKNFYIGDNLNLLKVENCKGGRFSFGGDTSFGANPITVSGTFIDCEVEELFSFGFSGTASGTFINCQGGDSSFGSEGTASGTFTNCQGGDSSFGGNGGTASGTFINCQSGNDSFGSNGTLSGKLYRCQLTSGTFQTPSSGGKIVLGIDGNDDVINLG